MTAPIIPATAQQGKAAPDPFADLTRQLKPADENDFEDLVSQLAPLTTEDKILANPNLTNAEKQAHINRIHQNRAALAQLGNELDAEENPGFLTRVGEGLTDAAVETAKHPLKTAESIVTAPVHSAQTLGAYLGQKTAEETLPADVQRAIAADKDYQAQRVSGQDAAAATAQLLANIVAPETGALGGGALLGAAYSPDDPLVGATIGGVVGKTLGRATEEAGEATRSVRARISAYVPNAGSAVEDAFKDLALEAKGTPPVEPTAAEQANTIRTSAFADMLERGAREMPFAQRGAAAPPVEPLSPSAQAASDFEQMLRQGATAKPGKVTPLATESAGDALAADAAAQQQAAADAATAEELRQEERTRQAALRSLTAVRRRPGGVVPPEGDLSAIGRYLASRPTEPPVGSFLAQLHGAAGLSGEPSASAAPAAAAPRPVPGSIADEALPEYPEGFAMGGGESRIPEIPQTGRRASQIPQGPGQYVTPGQARALTEPVDASRYHVTGSDAADAILREGFKPSAQGELGRGVYLIENRDDLSAPRFAGKQALAVDLAPGKRLLPVDDGPNLPLQIMRALHGYDAGTEAYESLKGQIFGARGKNWDALQQMVRDKGYAGISLRNGASEKNAVVFDPADIAGARHLAPSGSTDPTGIIGSIKPDMGALLHGASESLADEGMAAPGPDEQDAIDRGETPQSAPLKVASRPAFPAPTEAASAEATQPPAPISRPTETVRGAADVLRAVRDQTERRSLERAANTDGLTGLANQRAWAGAKDAVEADPQTAVIRLDVNGLKAVNDAAGHAAGDAAIREAARIVRQHAPGIAARVGGDEFALAVPADRAQDILDAIHREVGVRAVDTPHGPVRYSISGGIGSTEAEADAAAYRQKAIDKAVQGIAERSVGAREMRSGTPASPYTRDERPLPELPSGVPRQTDEPLLNARTFDQSPVIQRQLANAEASMEARGVTKERVPIAEGRARVQKMTRDALVEMGMDPLTMDLNKVKRLSGEEIVAFKQAATDKMDQVAALSKRLEAPGLGDDEREQLTHLLNQTIEDRDNILEKIVYAGSQKGRDLNFLRQIANRSLDPDVWVVQARRLAGDRPLSDAAIAEIRKMAREAAEACA